MILLLADGVSYRKIQDLLDTTALTIAHWKERFLKHRMPGLMEERHPGQKPSVRTPRLQAKVLAAIRTEGWLDALVVSKTREPLSGQQRDHSADSGASRYAASSAKRYMSTDDLEFETKAADVIGLYLTLPQHAAVFRP